MSNKARNKAGVSDRNTDKDLEMLDSLNKEHIEQYHRAVLNFSSQSFELKKICVTVDIAAFTLIATIFRDSYGDPNFTRFIFITGIVVPFLFYIVDISTYYYQDRLRMSMYKEEKEIRNRHNFKTAYNKRFEKVKLEKMRRILRAVVSGSNFIYWSLVTLALIFGAAFVF